MSDALQLRDTLNDLRLSFDTSIKPEEIQSPFSFNDTSELMNKYSVVICGIMEELNSLNSYVLKGNNVGTFAVHTGVYLNVFLPTFIHKLTNTLKTEYITLQQVTNEVPWNTSLLEIVEHKASLLAHELRAPSEIKILTTKAQYLVEGYDRIFNEFLKHISNCEAAGFTDTVLTRCTTQVKSEDSKHHIDNLILGTKNLSIINTTFIKVFEIIHELIHQIVSPLWELIDEEVQFFNSPNQVNYVRMTEAFVERAEVVYNKKMNVNLSPGLEASEPLDLLKVKANAKTSPDVQANLKKAMAKSRNDSDYLFNSTKLAINHQQDVLKKLDKLAIKYENKPTDVQERFVRSRYGDRYIGSKELKARTTGFKSNWEQLIKLQEMSSEFLTSQLKVETVDSKKVDEFKKAFNTQLKTFGKTIQLGLLQTSSKPEEFAWWDWSPIPSTYPSTSEIPTTVKEIREAITISTTALDEFVKYNAELYRKFNDMVDVYIGMQNELPADSDKFEFIFPMTHVLSKLYYYMTSLLYSITTYLTYWPTESLQGIESFGSDMDNVLGNTTSEDEVEPLEPETEGSPLTEEIYTKESDDPEVESGTE